jgi:hypothetical protein
MTLTHMVSQFIKIGLRTVFDWIRRDDSHIVTIAADFWLLCCLPVSRKLLGEIYFLSFIFKSRLVLNT